MKEYVHNYIGDTQKTEHKNWNEKKKWTIYCLMPEHQLGDVEMDPFIIPSTWWKNLYE